LSLLHSGDASARLFARPADELSGAYELARLGRLAQSPSLAAQALRGFLERAELNAEKLPEFSQVSHYLQPAGGLVVTRDDGSDIILFSLKNPMPVKPVDKK
jgi:hypothetical protein